jgi:hypothetical protein
LYAAILPHTPRRIFLFFKNPLKELFI